MWDNDTMKKAVILHGTAGSPEGNWFRWLERELKKRGFKVWLPQLPHADLPSLREELDFIRENAPFSFDDDTLIVGHSSGATLSLLVAAKYEVGAVVAVAPFVPMSEVYNATAWEANAQLFDVDVEKMLLRYTADQHDINTVKLVIFSDDDPYIPPEVPQHIADITRAEALLLPNQGHFNLEKSADYQKFPELLTILEEKELI